MRMVSCFRMNITPSPGRKRKSAGDGSSANRSKKRKLRTEEYFSSETVHSTKLIGLEIVDADPEGRFVTVQNHTNQVLSTDHSLSFCSYPIEELFD